MSVKPPVSKRLTLLTASGVCSLIVLDTNIVAVTLPSIARDLGANFADIEWVVSAYMLAFAALLLPAGSLADRFGRQKTLLCGLVIFILASIGCGAAPQPSDARIKMPRPQSRVFCRPKRSARLPAGNNNAAKASI